MIGIGIGVPRIRFVTAGGISAPPLLLDTYSGAAVSYSLRGLSTSYVNGPTPYACQVRNSSNVPLNIGFVFNSLTGEYELDVATLLAHCAGGNGFVDVWYTQSGNNYNATQIDALSQPQIVSSGSVILENGQPAVQFDGSDDFLSYTFSTNLLQPGTYFVVNKNTSGIGIVSSDDSFSRWQIYRPIASPQPINIFSGSILSSGTSSNNQVLIYSLFNGLNSAIGINNNSAIIGDAGTQENSAIRLGVDSNVGWGQNKMQEVILYNSDQSSNRTSIETNINNFYSIY
jgi:hypothetical protein